VAVCKIMDCNTVLNLESKKSFDKHLGAIHESGIHYAFGAEWRNWRKVALTVVNSNGSYIAPSKLSKQLQWSNQNPWPSSHVLQPPSSLLFCQNTENPNCSQSTAASVKEKKCPYCNCPMVQGWGQTFYPHGAGGLAQWIQVVPCCGSDTGCYRRLTLCLEGLMN
jgi:ssDNA-binding Zn-finger/Zn-ribbon topoisomerase 1